MEEEIIPEDLVERFRQQERARLDVVAAEAAEEKEVKEKEAKELLVKECSDAVDALVAGFEASFATLKEKRLLTSQYSNPTDRAWKDFREGLLLLLIVALRSPSGDVVFDVRRGRKGSQIWLVEPKGRTNLTFSEASIYVAEFLGEYRAYYKV